MVLVVAPATCLWSAGADAGVAGAGVAAGAGAEDAAAKPTTTQAWHAKPTAPCRLYRLQSGV